MRFIRLVSLTLVMCATTVSAALAAPPTVEKTWSWDVTPTTAGLSMNVNPGGKRAFVEFRVGPEASAVSAGQVSPSNNVTGAHATATGLKPGTKYTYAAVARTDEGTAQLAGSFTTLPAAGPVIGNVVVKSVSYNGAVISGKITSVADGAAHLIVFPSNMTPAITTAQQHFTHGAPEVQFDLTGHSLTPDLHYGFRMVVNSPFGSVTSAMYSFRTEKGSALPPAILSVGHRPGTSTAAVSVALRNYGLPSNVVFHYGTNPGLGATAKATPAQIVAAAATETHGGATLGDLIPGTTYYWRAAVSTTSGAKESAIQKFTTDAPTIQKVWSWNEAATTAGLSMNVQTYAMKAQANFVYGTDPALANGIATRAYQVITIETTGQHAELAGLTPGTTYYYQAVLTSAAGTAKSPIQSFKTK
jgi:hypothetical protein